MVSLPPPAASPAAARKTYRQESSLSPARFSRSLSRVRLLRSKEVSPSSPSPSRPRRDVRQRLPTIISRFLGYRPPHAAKEPLFAWQKRIPVRVENSVLSCTGSLVSIILIESVMIRSQLFHDWGGPPLIVASLGASAVLLFSTFESPLAQPRNALGGQILSSLVGIIIVRLISLSPSFIVTDPPSRDEGFARLDWLAAALSMSLALLVMELTGTVHPPGGATALIVCTQGSAVQLSWRFLLVIFASITLMIALALVFDNLGRRKYPTYWFSPHKPAAIQEARGQSGVRDMELSQAGAPMSGTGKDMSPLRSDDAELDRRGRKPRSEADSPGIVQSGIAVA